MGASCVQYTWKFPDFSGHVYSSANTSLTCGKICMHLCINAVKRTMHSHFKSAPSVARSWPESKVRVRIKTKEQRCLSEWPADAGLPRIWAYFIDLMVTALTTIAMYILFLDPCS